MCSCWERGHWNNLACHWLGSPSDLETGKSRDGRELWSGQKTCYVCQTPGHGSQAALLPQTFDFHWPHGSGEGKSWSLGRGGERKCSSLIFAIEQGVAEKAPFHLTSSGKIKWLWSSVRFVWSTSRQSLTLYEQLFPRATNMNLRHAGGHMAAHPMERSNYPFPSCGSLCRAFSCILHTAIPPDGMKSSTNGNAYILGMVVIKGRAKKTMPLSERVRQRRPYQPTFLNWRMNTQLHFYQ